MGLDVFDDKGKFKPWIKKPALALGSETPEVIMVTNEGINKVSDLLGRMNHGVII